MTATDATAAADLEETKRLAAEFEALGGGALTMALAQEAESGDHLRECWLAHERLRVSEARMINRAEILTARTDTAAEVAEVAAAEAAAAEAAATEAAAAEAAAAVKAATAAEAVAAAWAAANAAADALGVERPSRPSCRKSLAAVRTAWPRTPRRSPGGPCLVWGAERNWKLEAGRSAEMEQTRQSRPRGQHPSSF